MNLFITGTAGFIGFHLAKLLLDQGHTVHGYDAITDYYDINLKKNRHEILRRYPNFSATEALLENEENLFSAMASCEPNVIVHLAAQAGVRYSLENPRAYIDSNVIGTFNVLEGARRNGVRHLLIASTSSIYGANETLPYAETMKADLQMSFYAATKKAGEAMSHSYAHLHGIPTTMFRFFTVYGPWGRPDMALFKFTEAILNDSPIDIYNNGEMWRDFTYVDDLVAAIRLLIDCVPTRAPSSAGLIQGDSLSPVAPFRIVNIGNSEKVRLLDFVEIIEKCLEKKAIRNYMEMQPGDVPATWANAELLHALTGYRSKVSIDEGVSKFVTWYRQYFRC